MLQAPVGISVVPCAYCDLQPWAMGRAGRAQNLPRMRIQQDGLQNGLVQCIQQRNALMTYESLITPWKKQKEVYDSWSQLPWTTMLQNEDWGPTTSCCTLRRERRLWWRLLIPSFVFFFHRLAVQPFRPSKFCLPWSQIRNAWSQIKNDCFTLWDTELRLPVRYSVCCWNV